MATGTGKTITALAAATDLYYDINKLLVVICCPNSVLVDQWNKEAKQFNFDPILAIENYKKWNPQIKKMRRFFQKDLINIGMIITNKQTMFSSNTKADFLGLLNKFDELPILFIADEVHNLGSENIPPKLKSAMKLQYEHAFEITAGKMFQTFKLRRHRVIFVVVSLRLGWF